MSDLGPVDFGSLTALEGGWSGETYVAEAGGERQVVRIHARDPARAEVDAALLRLVRGLVPVADVLEVRPPRDGPDGPMPALLVTSFLPGVRGDLLLPTLDDEGLAVLGAHVGDLVATLGGMPMPRVGGFVGADLAIQPFDVPDPPAFRHWSYDERAGLATITEEALGMLDAVDRTCLVHSDLNPKNLLVDPRTLEITGLLDWEYAHAGHPFTDLGNVLRFERHPAYADAVLAAYEHRRGTPPTDALALARAADLWALTDLAGRRGQNPVAERAHDLLRGIAASGDLGWTLPEAPA